VIKSFSEPGDVREAVKFVENEAPKDACVANIFFFLKKIKKKDRAKKIIFFFSKRQILGKK
jgi:hypothetical protein